MAKLYKAYVQPNKRRLLAENEITLKRAKDFLKETKDGLIVDSDGNEYKNIEELNAKDFRSLPGLGESDFPASGRKVHENSYRELFKTPRDNTEPSSERDN